MNKLKLILFRKNAYVQFKADTSNFQQKNILDLKKGIKNSVIESYRFIFLIYFPLGVNSLLHTFTQMLHTF